MDLNYLYQRHQVSMYMEEHATSDTSREGLRGLAQGYAEMIARAQGKARRVAAR